MGEGVTNPDPLIKIESPDHSPRDSASEARKRLQSRKDMEAYLESLSPEDRADIVSAKLDREDGPSQ